MSKVGKFAFVYINALPQTPNNFNMELRKQEKAEQIFYRKNVLLLIVERLGGENKLGISKNRNTRLSQFGLENELKTTLSLFMKPG